MADDVLPLCIGELKVLRSMAVRLRAGERFDRHEVERRVEAGVGALIGLEAQLVRMQRVEAPEPSPDCSGASADLKHRISELREALTELRTLAVPWGESRVGYGFVLPGHEQEFHAHLN